MLPFKWDPCKWLVKRRSSRPPPHPAIFMRQTKVQALVLPMCLLGSDKACTQAHLVPGTPFTNGLIWRTYLALEWGSSEYWICKPSPHHHHQSGNTLFITITLILVGFVVLGLGFINLVICNNKLSLMSCCKKESFTISPKSYHMFKTIKKSTVEL